MRKRFTEEQIIAILQEQQVGATVADIIRCHSISEQIFWRWKSKFGGMAVSIVKRCREHGLPRSCESITAKVELTRALAIGHAITLVL